MHGLLGLQVVHFVRHGEGFHNIGIVNEDAHLTEAVWRQAEALNKHIQQLKPAIDVQVPTAILPMQASHAPDSHWAPNQRVNEAGMCQARGCGI